MLQLHAKISSNDESRSRSRSREKVKSFYSGLMMLILLIPMCRLCGITLRTLRSLLNAYNPRKVVFTLILFLEKVRRVKGGPESAFTKPGSDALTLPIKDANTSCKPRLEDDPHWPPRPEKRR